MQVTFKITCTCRCNTIASSRTGKRVGALSECRLGRRDLRRGNGALRRGNLHLARRDEVARRVVRHSGHGDEVKTLGYDSNETAYFDYES